MRTKNEWIPTSPDGKTWVYGKSLKDGGFLAGIHRYGKHFVFASRPCMARNESLPIFANVRACVPWIWETLAPLKDM